MPDVATTTSIYAGEFGGKFIVYTECSDLFTASSIYLRFSNLSTEETTYLPANAVLTDTTNYSVEAAMTEGWSDDMAGEWVGQVEINWNGAKEYGTPFTLIVENPPSI